MKESLPYLYWFCRSSSACTGNQKPQRPYRRSASMDVKVAGPQDCRCKAAAAKFGWSGAHTKDKQTEVKLFGEGARGPTKKIDVATVKSNRYLITSRKFLIRN